MKKRLRIKRQAKILTRYNFVYSLSSEVIQELMKEVGVNLIYRSFTAKSWKLFKKVKKQVR